MQKDSGEAKPQDKESKNVRLRSSLNVGLRFRANSVIKTSRNIVTRSCYTVLDAWGLSMQIFPESRLGNSVRNEAIHDVRQGDIYSTNFLRGM